MPKEHAYDKKLEKFRHRKCHPLSKSLRGGELEIRNLGKQYLQKNRIISNYLSLFQKNYVCQIHTKRLEMSLHKTKILQSYSNKNCTRQFHISQREIMETYKSPCTTGDIGVGRTLKRCQQIKAGPYGLKMQQKPYCLQDSCIDGHSLI